MLFVLLLSLFWARPGAALSWEDCGGSKATITDFFVIEPLRTGVNNTAVLKMSISEAITNRTFSEIKVEVTATLNGLPITLSCNNNSGWLGSCAYKDPCSRLLERIPICREVLTPLNIPCKCPILPGDYAAEDIQFKVKEIKVPFKVDGVVTVKMRFVDFDNTDLLCFEASIAVEI